MTRLPSVFSVLGLAALLVLAGCDSTSTEPSSGAPSGTPVITGTVPAQPSLRDIPQLITVSGHDFETGMVGSLLRPDGRVVNFVASELRQFTSTSFQLSLTLDLAGDYSLSLTNPSGLTSVPVTLRVLPAAQGALMLISVSPANPRPSATPTTIFVTGTNFDNSLEAVLTGPDSSLNFYPSTSMTGLSPTSFSLDVLLDRLGVYKLVVRNGSNSTSNELTIQVSR